MYVHAPGDRADIDGVDDAIFQTGLSWLKNLGDAVTMSEVNDVARWSRCTTGKWKIQVQAEQLERTWERVARAVHSGALGNVCISAKVSTTTVHKVRDRGTEHTIYVYVGNYLNE